VPICKSVQRLGCGHSDAMLSFVSFLVQVIAACHSQNAKVYEFAQTSSRSIRVKRHPPEFVSILIASELTMLPADMP
jgi:hypothetical protein